VLQATPDYTSSWSLPESPYYTYLIFHVRCSEVSLGSACYCRDRAHSTNDQSASHRRHHRPQSNDSSWRPTKRSILSRLHRPSTLTPRIEVLIQITGEERVGQSIGNRGLHLCRREQASRSHSVRNRIENRKHACKNTQCSTKPAHIFIAPHIRTAEQENRSHIHRVLSKAKKGMCTREVKCETRKGDLRASKFSL